ncbi:MAG: translocation/assembly module TamB domain-containing protein [Verrucomicrobiota bacterium JB022]|nr:translocation/assembly module TamB domain-containing protein [Verrucomicrobiota bacterium JB022]
MEKKTRKRFRWVGGGLGLIGLLILALLGAHPWLIEWLTPWALEKAGLQADSVSVQGYRALRLQGVEGTVSGYRIEGETAEVPLLFPYGSFFLADEGEKTDDVLIQLRGWSVAKVEPPKDDDPDQERSTPRRVARLIDQLMPRLQQYLPGTQLENIRYAGYESSWQVRVQQAQWQPVAEALQAEGTFVRNEEEHPFTVGIDRGERWTYALNFASPNPSIRLEGSATLAPTGWQVALDGNLYGGPTEISAQLPESAWLPSAAHLAWQNPSEEIVALTSRGVELEQGQLQLDWDGTRWAVNTQGNGTYTREDREPTPWELLLVAESPGAPTLQIQQLEVETQWADAQLRSPVSLNWQTYELDAPAQLRARVPLQPYMKEGEWPPLLVNLRARPLRRAQGLEYRADFHLPDNASLPGHVQLNGTFEQGQLVLEALQADLQDVGTLSGHARAKRGEEGFELEQVQLGWDFDGEALRARVPQLEKVIFTRTTGQINGQGAWPDFQYEGEVQLSQLDVAQVPPLDVNLELQGRGMEQVSLQPEILRDEANRVQLAVQVQRSAQQLGVQVQQLQWHHGSATVQLAEPFSVSLPQGDDFRVNWTAARLTGPETAPGLNWEAGKWSTANGGNLKLSLDRWVGDWLQPWLEAELPRAGVERLAVDLRTEDDSVVGKLQAAGTYYIEEQDVPVRAQIQLQPGLAVFDSLQVGLAERPILNAQGSLPFSLGYAERKFSYELQTEAGFEFRLDLNLDRPRVRRVLEPLGIVLGGADATIDLEGSIAAPVGQIRLRAQTIDYDHASLKEPIRLDDLNLNARIRENAIDVPLLAFTLRQYNGDYVRMSLRARNFSLPEIIQHPGEAQWQEIDYLADIERLPVAALMPVANQILQPQGSLSGEVRWRGQSFRPGTLDFENLAFKPMGGGLTLRSFGGQLGLDGRTVTLNDVSGQWSGQPLRFGGHLNFDNLQAPKGELTLQGDRLELVRQAGLLLRGDIDVKANIQNGLQQVGIAGGVTLHDSMLLRDMRDLLRSGPASAASKPPFFAVAAKPYHAWTLDLDIRGDQFMRIQAPFVSGELSADLHLEGTLGDPRLIGDIPLQPGAVRFPFAKIPLETAAARITLEDPSTVKLEASGQGYSFGYDVQLSVSGTMTEPELRLSSTPPLSEESILVMLTTGSVPSGSSSGEGSNGLQRAGSLAYYVGQDLFSPLFQSGGSERIRIMQGGSLSQFGQRTTAVEFSLSDGFSLIGEYDEYGDYNIDVKWDIFER